MLRKEQLPEYLNDPIIKKALQDQKLSLFTAICNKINLPGVVYDMKDVQEHVQELKSLIEEYNSISKKLGYETDSYEDKRHFIK